MGLKKPSAAKKKTSSASTSKNSRGKSSIPGAGKAPVFLGDIRFVTPLNFGKHARVLDAKTGRNVHAKTDSPEFDAAVADVVAAGFGARVEREFETLAKTFPADGWDKVAARLTAAGILPPAA